MKARELLKKAGYEIQTDFEVHDIQMDSRLIEPGDIFIALAGAHTDGHRYIASAIEKGAKLILTERKVEAYDTVVMEDGYKTLSTLAYYFYGEPTKDMEVIGVTGTNGKTTTTTLLYQALNGEGRRCGLIGTNGLYYPEGFIPLNNTTPDALLLMRYFKKFKDMDIHTVVMEVSSHALVLGRVDYVNYKVAVFTNLTQDHLDFHKDMEDYFNAKKMLFTDLEANDFAILNYDDATYERLAKATKAKVISYGIRGGDHHATNIALRMEDTQFDIENVHVTSDLLSIANVYNLLAVYSVMRALGYEKTEIVSRISKLPHIDGRMEKVYNQDYLALVDYAHSPDSVSNALTFLNEIKKGRLIALVGCGGDRDKSKRPKMAKVACEKADLAILTSDNPRTENPEDILKDMQEGLNYSNYCVIVNRKEAINRAVAMAEPGDIIAVLGKGHEDYQIIGTTKYHFSDKEEILKAIKGE